MCPLIVAEKIEGHDWAGTIIREHVTGRRVTIEHGNTVVGSDYLLPACSHVGHGCTEGCGVVLANCALLGESVCIGGLCFLGGGAAVHEHGRIEEHVILGGCAANIGFACVCAGRRSPGPR